MSFRILLAPIITLVLTANLSAATITSTGLLLSKKQWNEAEKSARSVLDEKLDNPDAHAMLGIALYHQGEFAESVSALEKAADGGTAYETRVLYYLGLACSKAGMQDDAAEAFSILMVRYPESAEARKLQGVSPDVTVPAEKRSGMDMSGTVLSMEAGYDTNPDLIEDGDSDLLASLYYYTDLDFEAMPCLVGVSLFIEKYLDLTENDFIDLAVDLNDQIDVGERDSVEWSVEISQSIVDYEAFERNLSASAEYTHPWRNVWVAELRALAAWTDADEGGYDATRARLRFRLYRYLLDFGLLKRLRFRAETYMNDRDTEWVAYSSVSAGIDCRLDLPHSIMLDLGLLLESREYDGADPDTLVVREDDLIEVSAYALKPIQRNQYLTAQAVFTTRDSNNDFYSADELQLLIGALWVK